MIHLGNVPASSTLYIPFTTYDKTNGASVTMSGFAVTDIEIYKNGSTTQRSSDNGYTLLDTDGIDFDGITGLHGFSVDLSDNSDAGFYAVGSFYWVVVSTITVDSQTITFVAATFRIVAAEGITGKPKVDVDGFGGSAGTFASGIPEVKVASIANNAITANSIASDAITDAKVAADVTIASVTGAVGSVTGNVGGNVTGSVGSVAAGGIAAASFAAGAIDATAIAADAIGSSELAASAANEIADAILDRDMSTGADSGSTTVRTVRQALRFLRNKWAISAGTLTVYKEDDSTSSWTSAVSTDAAAVPVIGNDPAGP